ncbi:exodeoxyribonuclease III [Lacihabitans sp. LS3-19]|uniref:exodeoxyribonuclease III n=1 Tax=Lacihabitans sp. LS3-19 TaxID=2487335 RepID=UPI0020CEAE28|nr:exodeoxyribonuclease III [Lacihabitans sp. LS3-19]MCP9766365.1 exodeoxyribonuclease III [Lacihabitans sp. LS3-19]
MKITTFNVNGIRSALNKGLEDWLKNHNPDILCLQEIKLSETELVEPVFTALGYHCHWYPAQKKGYSGVAILSKTKPENVSYGIGIDQYDSEGRTIIATFEKFHVVCAYFPSGTTGDIRQDIKMKFLDDIYTFVHAFEKTNKPLLLCGDVNICHEEIDIHNPKSNAKSSGFLPEERAWVGKFLDSGFIDSFRHKNTDPQHYTWWSYRAGARAKNLGWRIDYIFATADAENIIANANIHADVVMSDHCPVSVELSI